MCNVGKVNHSRLLTFLVLTLAIGVTFTALWLNQTNSKEKIAADKEKIAADKEKIAADKERKRIAAETARAMLHAMVDETFATDAHDKLPEKKEVGHVGYVSTSLTTGTDNTTAPIEKLNPEIVKLVEKLFAEQQEKEFVDSHLRPAKKASCSITCYTDAETKKPYVVLVYWDKDGKTQTARVESDQQADVTGLEMTVTVTAK